MDISKDANNATIAHALAQATNLSGTDASNFVNELAGGSPETSKPALQELVRTRLAQQLQTEAASASNYNQPPQNYIGSRDSSTRTMDPLVFKLGLLSNESIGGKPSEQQAIINSLPPERAAAVLKDFKRMKAMNLLGTNTGSQSSVGQ